MKTHSKIARILVALGMLALVLVAAHLGGSAVIGTLCTLCPVGFLQVAAASRSVPWPLVPGVVALLVVVLLLGRVFCSWACPSQLLRNIFGGHAPRGIRGRSGRVSAEEPDTAGKLVDETVPIHRKAVDRALPTTGESAPAASIANGGEDCRSRGCASCASADSLKTQGLVLVVLLVVSFAVGFPVFCLLCPIGLTFGALWALNRMFVLLQPGWELVVFPLMLLAELFFFKRWCSTICPLGFFFGLIGKARAKLGFGVRPRAKRTTCLSRSGCHACSTVCPEDIDVSRSESHVLEACTLCGDCKENCPSKSIELTFNVKKSDASSHESKQTEGYAGAPKV